MAYEKFTTSCSFVSLVEGEKNLLRLYRYMFLSEKDDGYYETSSFESDTLELKDDNGKLNICFNVATTAHLKCKPKLMPLDVETKQETKNRNIRFQRTFSDGVLHYPKTFGFAYTSLSFFGILYCVMIPILFDQPFILNEGHCEHQNVDNFFPWVSHAIIYSPHTKTIWSLCVLLNSPILFALAKHLNTKYHHLFEAYARSNADTLGKREIAFYHSLLNVVYLLNNVQVISLLLLTLFGAKSFWDIHFMAAVTLFVSMCIFSVFVCIVEAKLRPIKILKCFPIEIDFFKFRVVLTTIFLISILLALVFYIWFSCFCTDYVYSLFGLFELISSVSLLLFHSLTYVLVEDLPTQIERLKAH